MFLFLHFLGFSLNKEEYRKFSCLLLMKQLRMIYVAKADK